MRRSILAVAALAALTFGGHAYGQSSMFPRNLLICGDADNCPNQRGTSVIGGDIAGTGTMTLDAWEAVGGASSAINVSVAALPSAIPQFTNGMKFQRKASNANTATIHLGQVIETLYATPLQGQRVCFQYDVVAGSLVAGTGFSANAALLSATVYSGTGSNEGYASMIAGTWTGTGTVLSAPATVTTTGQNVSACATVPGNATEVGVDFSYVPVGTAGASDYVTITAVQLEQVTPTGQPTAYEHFSPAYQFQIAARRAWVVNEPAASVQVANGSAVTTAYCQIGFQFPYKMVGVPTVSFTGTALGGTTWALISASATPIALASTYLVQSALGVNTTQFGALKATGLSTPFTAGNGCQLVGAGGGSKIVWSADLT